MTTNKWVAATLTALVVTTASVTAGCEWLAQHTPLPSMAPPTASATPTENAQERQMRLDKEAAVKAYTAVSAEDDRLAMAGGASKPTKVLTDNAAGFYLQIQMNGPQGVEVEEGFGTDRNPVRLSDCQRRLESDRARPHRVRGRVEGAAAGQVRP